ncbi:DDE superfamily endonuclease [Popillia japonica]|uniref:DDE superfamily endonuclease n=1 Tax=Popillia japonica TaxID=7064 RepID=A0AAW1N4J5_POPJA
MTNVVRKRASVNNCERKKTDLKGGIGVLQHFVRHTSCNPDNRFLMLLDNHESYASLSSILYAREHGIELLSFSPHTSHRLQPLDIGVYGSFKSKYSQSFNDWLVSHPGKTITIRHIPKLTAAPFIDAFSPKNITIPKLTAAPFIDAFSPKNKTITIRHIPKLTAAPFIDAFSPKNITSSFKNSRFMACKLPEKEQPKQPEKIDSTTNPPINIGAEITEKEQPKQPEKIDSTSIPVCSIHVASSFTKKHYRDPRNYCACSRCIPSAIDDNCGCCTTITPESVRPFPKMEKLTKKKRKMKEHEENGVGANKSEIVDNPQPEASTVSLDELVRATVQAMVLHDKERQEERGKKGNFIRTARYQL